MYDPSTFKLEFHLSNKSSCWSQKNSCTGNDYQKLQDAFIFVTQEYYDHLAMKLNNTKISTKKYWSILKTFYNGHRIPLISPLPVNNCFISDFKGKWIQCKYSASHCTPLESSNIIPNSQVYVSDTRIDSVIFHDNDINHLSTNPIKRWKTLQFVGCC